MQHVLIQGAGIAGAVLAFWLQRLGFAITFVERSARPRSGGQAVDVRGTALEVVARMDLLDELNAQRTRFLGMLVYDEKGHEFERVANRTIGSRPEDGDIELFRDDLSRTLYAGVGSAPTFIFGDEVADLHESSSGVQVTLASGRQLQADFVVGAVGVNSGLRRLVFGTDAALLRHLGFYGGFYSRPNIPRLEGWQLVVRTGERGVILYPSRNNAELRVCLYFATGELDPASGDPRLQRELFKNHCGGIGGPFEAAVEAIDRAEDVYASPMAQVQMERWFKGRVVLVGDAAYCPSPLTGQGTSLALVGAYVLAQELARGGRIEDRMTRYEHRLRAFVTVNQAIDAATGRGIDLAKNAMDLDADPDRS